MPRAEFLFSRRVLDVEEAHAQALLMAAEPRGGVSDEPAALAREMFLHAADALAKVRHASDLEEALGELLAAALSHGMISGKLPTRVSSA